MASSIQSIPTKTISNALNYFVLNGNNCAALPSSTPRMRKVRSGNNLKLTTPVSTTSKSPKKTHKRHNSLNKNASNYKVLVDDFPLLSSSHTTPDDKSSDYFFASPSPASPFESTTPTMDSIFRNESFASTITPSPIQKETPTTNTTESTSSSYRKGKFSNSKKLYDLLHTNAKLKEERLSLLEELHLYSSNTDNFYKEDPNLQENVMMVYSPTSDHAIVKSNSNDGVYSKELVVSPIADDSLSFFSQKSTQKSEKDLKLEAIHALQNMTHKQSEHITYLKHKIEICKKALEEKDGNISNLEMLLKQSRKESFVITRKMKSQEKELEGVRRELVAATLEVEEMGNQRKKDEVAILEYEGMVDVKNQLEFELELSKRNFLECSELLGEKEIEVEEWKDRLAQKELKIQKLSSHRSVNVSGNEEEEWIQSLEKEILQKEVVSTQTNLNEQLRLVKLLQTSNKQKLSTIAELQSQIQSLLHQKTIQDGEIVYLEQALENVQSLLQKSQEDTEILMQKVKSMDEFITGSQYCHLYSYLNLQEKNAVSSSQSDKFTKDNTIVRELSELTNTGEGVKQRKLSLHEESMDEESVHEQNPEESKLKEEYLTLQSEKEHLELDLQTLQETIQSQQTQICQLQNENTSLQEEVSTTREMSINKADTMEKEMEKLRTWARKALEQVKRLEKENTRCRKSIKGLQKQLGEQQAQNIELSTAVSAIHSVRSTSPITITGETTSEMNNNSMHGGASISNNSTGMDCSRHSTTSIDNNAKLEYLRTLNKIHENTISLNTTELEQKNKQLEKDLQKFKTAAATIRSELIKTKNAGESKEKQLNLLIEKLKQENQAYEIKIAVLENQFHEWNDRPEKNLESTDSGLSDDTTTCSKDEHDRIKAINDQMQELQKELAQLQPTQTPSTPQTNINNEEVSDLKAKLAEYQEIIEHLESDIHIFQEDSENIIETLRADVSNLSREKLFITQEKNKQMRFMQQEKIEMEEEFTRRIEELEGMLEQQQRKKPWEKQWNGNDDNLERIRVLEREKEDLMEVIQEHEDTIASLRSSSLYKLN